MAGGNYTGRSRDAAKRSCDGDRSASAYYTVPVTSMMRSTASSIVSCGVLAATAVLAAAPGAFRLRNDGAQQAPVFRGGVELVPLDVRVLDTEGRPVKGLTAEDFAVELDGKKQQVRVVDYFEYAGPASVPEVEPPLPAPGRAAPRPGQLTGRTILVAIDDISLRPQETPAFVADARYLINKLGPSDIVGLATTGGPFPAAALSKDKTRALGALGTIVGKRLDSAPVGAAPRIIGGSTAIGSEIVVSHADAIAISNGNHTVFGELTLRLCGRRAPLAGTGSDDQCAVAIRSEALQQAAGLERESTAQIDALRRMLDALREAAPPRILVMMSTGVDADAEHSQWLGALRSEARGAGIQVHVLMPGLGSGADVTDGTALRSQLRRENEDFSRRGLEILAGALDADIYKVVGITGPTMEKVLVGWSGSYRVGIDPPAIKRSGPVPVKVTVRRGGVTVRTAAFVLLRSPSTSTPPPEATAAVRSTEETLARAVDGGGVSAGVPMTIGSASKRDEAGHDVQIVTVEVPAAIAGPLSGLFSATDGANQVIQRGVLAFPQPAVGDDHRVSIVVPIAPGDYRVRVAVAEPGGAVGVVEHVGVARLARLRSSTVSDLLLSWVGSDGRGRFVPLEAVPEPARTLQASVEIYTAGESAATTVRMALLKDGASAPVAEAAASPVKVSTGWTYGVSIPLASLDAGGYIVRATITEGTDPPLVISRSVRKVAAPTNK